MSKSLNKILVVGGGKGGVGKSTVTMALVDALLSGSHSCVLVESDDSNPDTYKALKDLLPCHICNLDTEEGYIHLGNIIENHPKNSIVVNTAARATSALIQYGGILNDVAQEQNRELIMLWPINRQRDSLELLKDFLETAKPYHATYAVLNTYFGAPEKFARFANSTLKNRVSGTVIFPELNDLVADKLVDNRLSLGSADTKLSISERSALRRYREAAQTALKAAYE
ncbi:protein mobD [Acidithiobacillus caldus]|jgi:hypothetical protein|uniref:Mobilization protein n=1 Tax=Acidithiobacillus caldus TaxID=33059 RepID=Q840R6_9PROT|nr:hypothetical protein [Acidithiobacillus caldus]AAP04744.1 mobilization protein of unknown function [Acidithiobacillus caldus]ACA00197.1 mobilization protein [Acidithiobacillus caldus]MBU2780244.1 protein mobD [Acidithiobacillus caldus]MBU2820303.1 protein mobD [Acidithiobacillus caldus]